MTAKAHDVDLRHSGPDIRKTEGEQGAGVYALSLCREGFVVGFRRRPRLFPRFHRVVFQSVLL